MNDIDNNQQAAEAANLEQLDCVQEIKQEKEEEDDKEIIEIHLSKNENLQMNSQEPQMASSNQGSNMVMTAQQPTMISQQAMQSLQNSPSMATMTSQGGQQMAEWPGHGRVQVIQQPMQNPTYLQPVYNAQGQLIVPGNITIHQGGMGQPIQVIAAGKAFQPGQMPQMLAQGKPMVQGQATFPGYTTIPTSGNNQTLVLSPVNVLGQTNLLQQQQGKPSEMQKAMAKTNAGNNSMKSTSNQQQNASMASLVSSQSQGMTTQAPTILQQQILSPIQYTCSPQQQRGVPQGATQAMQLAPWNATFGTGLPPGIAWAPGALPGSTLLTQGGQIFIRNPQQDQTGMFIQNGQPSSMMQHNQVTAQQVKGPNQGGEMGGSIMTRPVAPKSFSSMPNSVGLQNIRPASSVSTQTVLSQAMVQQNRFQSPRPRTKVRGKTIYRMPNPMAAQKTDAANQTRGSAPIVTQPKSQASPEKSFKLAHSNEISQQSSNQQLIQQQIQEDMEQKTGTGQLIQLNSEVPNAGDRTTMTMLTTNPMGPIIGNVLVQTLPEMTAAEDLPNQQPQTITISAEVLTAPEPVPLEPQSKEENSDTRVQEPRENETGPGRPSGNDSNLDDSVKTQTSQNKEDTFQEVDSFEQANPSTENKENELRPTNDKDGGAHKATLMVKPQVLTHVIEGYVIQESSEPFPINRGNADNNRRSGGDAQENGEPDKKKACLDKEKEFAICEMCGKKDVRSKFKKSKRFCSMSCVRRFNVGCSPRIGLFSREDKLNSEGESDKTESSGESTPSLDEEKKNVSSFSLENNSEKVNPTQWTVSEVCDFIRNLPGCADYVEDFALQDIDGEALMLLKPDHLMSVMSMKLGPAVKIIAKIDTIRADNAPPADEVSPKTDD